MKSRRDLLKIFGAGVLIAPIVGARADESNVAQLIEIPKIKPVELFSSIPEPINVDRLERVTMLFDCANGTRHMLEFKPSYSQGSIRPGAWVNIDFNTNSSPVSSMAYISGGAYDLPHL